MNPILVVIGAQVLFTASDVIARFLMLRHGFTAAAFLSPWFFFYIFIREVAMVGQLYVFSTITLGKTMTLFAAASIILANILGFLLFREVLSFTEYLAISVIVIAFIFLALR